MVEHTERGLTKAQVEAGIQIAQGIKVLRFVASIGIPVRIEHELNLGIETEPYTEAQIDALMTDHLQTPHRRRRSGLKKA